MPNAFDCIESKNRPLDNFKFCVRACFRACHGIDSRDIEIEKLMMTRSPLHHDFLDYVYPQTLEYPPFLTYGEVNSQINVI